ncbi:MAG: hypothetical protein ACK4QP_14010, partial [Pseudorhizobium sp.]
FFTTAAAGAAAPVPAVAFAEASGKTSRLPRPLDVQLDECVARLRSILQQMHPTCEKVHSHLGRRDDGSFRFSIQGDVSFQPFQGEGVYLVSRDGWIWEYLVREERVVSISGVDFGYSHYFGRARAEDGGWDDHETFVTNFVRKVGEVPA